MILLGELSAIWSGVFALGGVLVGGVISFFTSVYAHRLTVISKRREEWISEFRKQFIQFMTELSVVRLTPLSPWEVQHSASGGEKFQARTRLFAEALSRLNLYLSKSDPKQKALFKACVDLRNLVMKEKSDHEEYVRLHSLASELAQDILAEQEMRLESELKKTPLDQF